MPNPGPSTPPLLDFAALTAAIPGEAPAGQPGAYGDLRREFERMRKEVDPVRPTVPLKADWEGLVKLATESLGKTSKDLRIASHLTEALVKLHGFAGLRDGLRLMRLLVEQCWERINPPVEDGDVGVRAGPFETMDKEDKGIRFPVTLKRVPLVGIEKEVIGCLDWKPIQDGKGQVTRAALEQAIREVPTATWEARLQDLIQGLAELNLLKKALLERLGAQAPALVGLQQAVQDCLAILHDIKKLLPAEPPPETAGPRPAGNGAAPAAVAPKGASRKDVYDQLRHLANVLRDLEPHSPIPHLIDRAVELGRMPFPLLLKEMVREDKILKELNREFGIREEPAAAKSK